MISDDSASMVLFVASSQGIHSMTQISANERHIRLRIRLWKLLVCCMSVAIAAGASHAQTLESDQTKEPLKQMTLEQLGNVEVTSVTKEPQEVWKTPAAIYVITQQDIERSGATSIPEALRLAPGVEVARIDSNKWSIGIRGFGSRLTRDVLVLIDGRTVYTTLLAGTYWEVQNVPLEDVDRIEVIRGPGGTIWGPNAVNGVINIITKSTKDTHGAFASVSGGNVDQGTVNVRYGGGNGKTFDYRVYGMGFDRGPEFHLDGHNYDSWRALQGGFRMDFSKDDRDNFMVQGDIYDEGAGETVTAVTYAPPYSQIIQGTERFLAGTLLRAGTGFRATARIYRFRHITTGRIAVSRTLPTCGIRTTSIFWIAFACRDASRFPGEPEPGSATAGIRPSFPDYFSFPSQRRTNCSAALSKTKLDSCRTGCFSLLVQNC